MSKSLNANFSGPFQVGAYENYLSKFSIETKSKNIAELWCFEYTHTVRNTQTHPAKLFIVGLKICAKFNDLFAIKMCNALETTDINKCEYHLVIDSNLYKLRTLF